MANSYYQRKATMDAVNAKKPAALRRDKDTDYTSGYFFVTLNVLNHKPILSTIMGHVDTVARTATDISVKLFPLGKKVQQIWQHIPDYHPNVQVIDCVVMPEHFHGLLHLEPKEGETLSNVVSGFKIGCYHAYKEIYPTSMASLFSAGFNETVPITADEVETKKQYIHDNPRRRLLKGQLRDCFTIFRGQHSPNWTLDRLTQGLRHDLFLARDPEALQAAVATLRPRLLLNPFGQLVLDYIGPRDLLLSANKLPLICHRADAEHFSEQSAAVLRAAKEGAVIVSAFISPREREILNQLIAMGVGVIEIVDNGFGKTYKPWGTSFYACAEGKLLQITPWNYLYQKDFTISRPMCMVMNELARLISGVEDDWWKK